MHLFLLIGLLFIGACHGATVKLSKLDPQGIQIAVDDEPGVSLVAVHYSINVPLSGEAAGQWNFDIRSKTLLLPLGDHWVHENKGVSLKPGDTVNYWIYMIVNGLGKSVVDQKWVVPGGASSGDSGASSGDSGASSAPSGPAPVSHDTPAPKTVAGDERLAGRTLELVLEDLFEDKFDTSKWDQEVSLYGGGNKEFQAYTNLADNTFTKDGKLFIKPTLTADKYGEKFLTEGRWDMKEYYGVCTRDQEAGCFRRGSFALLNPVLSGKLKSKAQITYGKVEIVAKLPRGDWLWPALWMVPRYSSYGGWPRSGEIDIMESRGNINYGTNGVDHFISTLHWGTSVSHNKYYRTSKKVKADQGTFADDFHTYTFYWDQSGMDFYLDGVKKVHYFSPREGFYQWGQCTGGNPWPTNNAPFDKPFYLIMNLAVGGTNGFFPDGGNKPWSNRDSNGSEKLWKAKDQWYPTWKGDDAALQVKSVRMWQLK